MRVAVFSTKPYDRRFLEAAAKGGAHELGFFEATLDATTVPLAKGFEAVCVFVHDPLSRPVLEALRRGGTRFVALRCAGFNNVDLEAAELLELPVVRVPAYSPHAVAEHTLALVLALNRCIHRAYNRVREGNFSLNGLLGFDLAGKTVGVIGTGAIGAKVARIFQGFGCQVLAHDLRPDPELVDQGVLYVEPHHLLAGADIVSLHCPLTPETHHLIDAAALTRMRRGAMLVNTSRGGLVDSSALIEALKVGRVGAVALDVYEEEAHVFFEDLSNQVLQDDVLARLLTFPNVLITSHQAFFTREAMEQIAATTLCNLDDLAAGRECPNRIR